MAFPSAVNDQIVDAVADLARLAADQPAPPSEAMLDVVLLQTIGSAMHDAVGRQRGAGIIGSAAVAAACARMVSIRPPIAPAPSSGIEPRSGASPAGPRAEADAGSLKAQLDASLQAAETARASLDEIASAAGAVGPSDRAGNGPAREGGSAAASPGQREVFRSAALSVAIAVQDAADLLRNVATVSTTAQGVAMTLLLATRDPVYAQAITQAQRMLTQAAAGFQDIGLAAAAVLKAFPPDRTEPGP